MFVYNKPKTIRWWSRMHEYVGKDVQLIYVDSRKNVTIRNVKILIAGEERFMAYCYLAKEVRTFNKSGIVDIEVMMNKVISNKKELCSSQ